MARGGKRAPAKPLTRSTEAGRPYARPPEVESQLEELLNASVDEQLKRAMTVDRESPQFIRDECLVYLIHEAWLADDSARYSALTVQLLRRCTRSIKRSLRALGVDIGDANDVYGKIVTAMVSAILDEDDKGDFYQVRFRRALRFLILKVYDQYAKRQQRAQWEDSLNAPSNGDNEAEEDGNVLEELVPRPGNIVDEVERLLVIREALEAIRDPRHRQVFVLYHYDDWPIETKDPLNPSISRHFGVTPRTVNNWLRAADRDLAQWRAANSA